VNDGTKVGVILILPKKRLKKIILGKLKKTPIFAL